MKLNYEKEFTLNETEIIYLIPLIEEQIKRDGISFLHNFLLHLKSKCGLYENCNCNYWEKCICNNENR